MPTPVVMPQMGESIAEGTIVRWIKHVGDAVERDEPLFEISTDKVDAEIPAPAAGVLTEITVQEGETVPVNSVVAMIGEVDRVVEAPGLAEGAAAPPALPAEASGTVGSVDTPLEKPTRRDAEAPIPDVEPPGPGDREVWAPGPGADTPMPSAQPRAAGSQQPMEVKEHRPQREARSPESGARSPEPRSSPLVRRIAREHEVDLAEITGTGTGGRVTKHDILAHLGLSHPGAPAPTPLRSGAPGWSAAPAVKPGTFDRLRAGETVEVVPMSVMRRKIAEHMVLSRRTSAHVHSVFEVNFTRVAQLREAKKAEYERQGAKLTYLSFIARAVVEALQAVPVVNASVDGDNIVYKRDINLGIAVALDWGLIVPVVKGAQGKNLLGLSEAIADLAARARAKRLSPDEVQGGTFTITNPGVFGALLGMPIINQPQLAILGVGAVEKRPVVIDDAIAIRSMAYLTLGYDHRVIDGAVADQFMSKLKEGLESFADE